MATYAVLAYRRLSAYDDYAHPANVKGYGYNDFSTSSNTAYPSANHRHSVKSSRLSIGSINEPPVSMDVLDTTPYHHQRDTQFDEYMAKRHSFKAPREGIPGGGGSGVRSPQAYSPPRGRGSPKRLSPPQSRSPPGPTTGPVVVPRATSWASDLVLITVPEEVETEHDRPAADEVSLMSRDGSEIPGLDGPRVAQETDIPEPKWK